MAEPDEDTPEILHVSFNMTAKLLLVCTTSGYLVYDTDPVRFVYRRDIPGGVKLGTTPLQSNLLAGVGTGDNPAYPTTNVGVYDAISNKIVASVSFATPAQAVIMSPEHIIVANQSGVRIYRFHDFASLGGWETSLHESGGLALLVHPTLSTLAFPSPNPGQLRWVRVTQNTTTPPLDCNSCLGSAPVRLIALDPNASRAAFVVTDDSRIQLADLIHGRANVIYQPSTTATLQTIVFSHDSSFLACVCVEGIVSIFRLEDANPAVLAAPSSVPPSNAAHNSTAVFDIHEVALTCAFLPVSNYAANQQNGLANNNALKILVVAHSGRCVTLVITQTPWGYILEDIKQDHENITARLNEPPDETPKLEE